VRIRSVFSHSAQAIANGALIAILATGLMAGTAFAAQTGSGKGHGGTGGTTCTPNTPGVSGQNTYAWASLGSFGLPGQQLNYRFDVTNYDVACGSSSFGVSISAPSGFSVSTPTSTISLASGGSGSLTASVTSPAGIADGDYPLVVTVTRAGTSATTGSFTTFYKVYSSDAAAPTLYWPSPGNGQAISGRSFWVQVSAVDDHAVKRIELDIDNIAMPTTVCDDISYSCSLYYSWATAKGQHTATFKAYDWLGNVSTLAVTFTVG
jgi:NPCBM-associated, NEW3 domain of alpha-galactosidase/Bacterial Ig domain